MTDTNMWNVEPISTRLGFFILFTIKESLADVTEIETGSRWQLYTQPDLIIRLRLTNNIGTPIGQMV
jgi:hypothetical protein